MAKTIYSVEYVDLVLLLRKKRLEAGLTQEQLARRVGVSRLVIGSNERGERRVDVIELQVICRALSVDFISFMTELLERQAQRR